ncbi:MAG: DNA methyltransferase [Candidatus Auribacterota bacterium]|jgi:site-specific DNA-methyltransferase (adenine-specific)|nr:DNA methyltransferase [Candidatus Auribacterota bacterium]
MKSEAYLMDCMDYMKTIPDNYFSLSVVDPPYGINMDGGKIGGNNCGKAKDYTQKDWDKEPPSLEYFKELMRVSKNQIVWGANHFISRMPFDSSCWIIWDKDNSGNFADCEMAWTSFNTAVRKYKFRWNGMLQQNMKDKEIRLHPTQKPVKLYEWIYHTYLPDGGKVFDSHLGSGSNRIAADKAGNIDFYSTEIDPDYFNDQEKRFRQYKSQLTLKF